MTPLLEASIAYAEEGVRVFPCEPRGKKPLCDHGCKEATIDTGAIRAWWARWPNANIGAATGDGLLVLDVDPENGGNESLARLERTHGALPDTAVVETGGGGRHHWYRLPGGVKVGNTAGRLGSGLDTRGEGGYVIAPPSVHPSSRRYQWRKRPDRGKGYAIAPEWLLDLLAPPALISGPRAERRIFFGDVGTEYGRAALMREVGAVAVAQEGTRNEMLNRAAFALGQLEAGGELALGAAQSALVDAALTAGLPHGEVKRTIQSGLAAGHQEPRSAPRPGCPGRPPRGPGLDSLRPATSINGNQQTPQLADVVAVFRRHLHLPDPRPLYAVLAAVVANRLDGDPVWLIIVGPSGGGKTELLNALGVLEHVHATATVTEPALLSGTSKKERAAHARGGLLREVGDFGILVLKDFGSVLSMHREQRGQVLAALREIYDGAWTRRLGVDGGTTLTWEGKLGLIGGCVPTLDQHYAVMATLGERFLLYRLAVDDPGEHARRSLAHVGGAKAMRRELQAAVSSFLAALQIPEAPTLHADVDRLVALSSLIVRARSPVVRDPYSSREIELVPDAEAPGRLVVVLGQLLVGLRALGLDDRETWSVVVKTGLDSMPALRRNALEYLIPAGGWRTTSDVSTSLDLPTSTAKRVLEDLTAHGVLERQSSGHGKADTWQVAVTTLDLHRAATSPEMSANPLVYLPNTTSDDISGSLPEPAVPDLHVSDRHTPSLGDYDFPALTSAAYEAGHLTLKETNERTKLHNLVRQAGRAA